jgi:diguanylate cyclase (GGDEF)-like protein
VRVHTIGFVATDSATARTRRHSSPQEGRLLFWGIQGLAFVSVLVPSGPNRPAWYFAAVGFAVLVALTRWLVPWARVSPRVQVIPLLLATAGIGCLIYSAGQSTGLGSLLLLPLLFSAFYGTPWESFLVIPAIGVAQVLLAMSNHDSMIVLARVVVFWMALLTMISLAAHALRRRLQSTVDAAEEEARQSAVVAEATRALTAWLEPDLVISCATSVAAELVSPISALARRGQYFEVSGDSVSIVSESDEAGTMVGRTLLPIAEHPMVRAVLETGEPVNGPIDLDACGPKLRAILEEFGVTHAAYVPIRRNGQISGVLSASSRGVPISLGLFARLRVLGSLTELALENASTHQLLEEQALTDPLTKLANRRELERAFGRLPDRMPYAYVAVDLDKLKLINDQYGHGAGDAVIVAVATAIASVSRRGDTVARVGGDEFAVLMIDASVDAVERLAGRIHQGLKVLTLESGPPTVSIGGCVAPPRGDSGLAQGVADAALYQAKHRGGSGTVITVFAETGAVLIA